MNHIIYRKNITYIQEQTIDYIYNQIIVMYPFTWLDIPCVSMTTYCLFVNLAWINCSVLVVTSISQNMCLVREYLGFMSIFSGTIVLLHYDSKVRLYLRLFVGGRMSYYIMTLKFVFTSVVCRRAHVLLHYDSNVHLYLRLFVGRLMSYYIMTLKFVFTSGCL